MGAANAANAADAPREEEPSSSSWGIILWENLVSFEVLFIGLSVAAFLYYQFKQDSKDIPSHPPSSQRPPPPPKPAPRDFTLEQLRSFDGTNGSPIYIAAKGKVYDMSSKPGFYGPEGPYHIFAGRDASRALAKSSVDVADVENTSIDDLDSWETDSLETWVSKYDFTYEVVGSLVKEEIPKPPSPSPSPLHPKLEHEEDRLGTGTYNNKPPCTTSSEHEED